jgi:tetratricopeptide (TPR) repeat protein
VKDLDIDALMTYLQNLREGKLKIQLDRLFDEIWGKFAAETQTALMSMLLSSRQGENREWVEIASGLSPEKLNTAWAVLDRVPVWRSIDTSDSRTPPSLSNRKSRRSQRRASDVSERRTLNPYTADRLISLGQKAPWKGWLEQRRETILQNLLQGQVIPDNLRWVFHHIESIEQLLINYFKGKKRLSLSFWQMLANYATIAFECGRWIEIKTLCDQIFAEVWNIDSLDEFLAIQEIVMVRCDAWSSINGTISNSDRVTEIKAFIDQIERDFSAFFKDHIDAQYITPLLDAVRALVIFNRGSSLIEARNLIDSALEGMDENLMSDAMAFSRGIAGFIYWRMGDSQARLLFTQALQHYRDTNQIFRTAWIESNIALAYQSWLTLDEAHDLIQSALNRGETLGQTWTTITNLGTRALIELARGRLKETALTFEQQEVHLIGAIPVKHQAQAYDQMWERLEYQDYDYDKEKHDVSMKREFARLMGNWGNVLIHQNQYEKAVKALKIDLKLGKGVRAVRSHCETHINLALALIQQGKPSDAIEHLQAASEIFEAGGYDILRLLWLRANALINPPDIALEQLNQAITIARQKGRRLDIAGILLQQSNLLPNTDSLRKEAIEILWEIGADGWSRRLKTGENVFIPLMY